MSTRPGTPRTVLLVVDVQHGNTAGAPDRDAFYARVRGLIDGARAAAVPVVWIQHEAGPFVPGSEAWQIVEAVRPAEGDTVIGKQWLDVTGDYVTWNVGAAYAITDSLALDVRYHDTDVDNAPLYDGRVAAALKLAF